MVHVRTLNNRMKIFYDVRLLAKDFARSRLTSLVAERRLQSSTPVE